MWTTTGPRKCRHPPHFPRCRAPAFDISIMWNIIRLFFYAIALAAASVRRSTDHGAQNSAVRGSDGSSRAVESVSNSRLEALQIVRFTPASIGLICILSLRHRIRICFGHCMRFSGTRPLDHRMNRSETREALTAKKKMCARPDMSPNQTPYTGPIFFTVQNWHAGANPDFSSEKINLPFSCNR